MRLRISKIEAPPSGEANNNSDDNNSNNNNDDGIFEASNWERWDQRGEPPGEPCIRARMDWGLLSLLEPEMLISASFGKRRGGKGELEFVSLTGDIYPSFYNNPKYE
ncbi:unnamed protein product [Polarella glacialis]|uniref:Uncharacterized protein n=1 Tax=Polarella glacialis TaxID=89957 RepID=A0A813EEY8_POLGL|nr:unnamed protein product [Polarella glacialis]